MKPLVLLRPEPGLSDSAARAVALGMTVIRAPLFALTQVPWTAPDATAFDALLLTSANAILFGGPGLERLKRLPVHVVGAATADAARAAGFSVASVGGGGIDIVLASLPRGLRLLHLGGEDRRIPQAHGASIAPITVYRAAPIDPPAGFSEQLMGAVAAVHSRRAGERLAEFAEARSGTTIAALSEDAAAGAGRGWGRIAIAGRPSDRALLALAAELCLEGIQ